MLKKIVIISTLLLSAYVYAEPPETLDPEQARNILENTAYLPDTTGACWDVVMAEDHGGWQSGWHKDHQLELLQDPQISITRGHYNEEEGKVNYTISVRKEPSKDPTIGNATWGGNITLIRKGKADGIKVKVQESHCPQNCPSEMA